MDWLHQKPSCTIETLGQEAPRFKHPLGLLQATNPNLAFITPVERLCSHGDEIHASSSDFNRGGSAQELPPPRRATGSNHSSKSAR